MSFGDHHDLSTGYDNRMRPTSWNVSAVLDYSYAYDYYQEHTGRVTYAQNMIDGTLDRSYQYDQVGALVIAHSGAEARASAYSGQWGTMDGPYSHGYDYDKFGNLTHRYGWGGEVQGGGPGQTSDLNYTYSNNKNQRDGFTYDAAGNLTNDQAYSYSYDATGQQGTASGANGYFLQQAYDGDGLRAQKIENGVGTFYIRSSVLGGQVVAELDSSGNWSRGYVYAGDGLMSVQEGGQVYWVHEDATTKGKRITDIYGNIASTVELDPWGADTNRSNNSAFLPQGFTTYIRDANGGQDAMARRYSASSSFAQPDPYGGSYDFSDPQSLNRYAHPKNDPVNFTDPSGLVPLMCGLFYMGDGRYGFVCFGDSEPFKGFNPKTGGGAVGKVTQNPSKPKPDGPACDKKLARLFGGDGAVADTGKTPSTLLHPSAGTQRFPDHSAEGGVMHLYTDAQGTGAPGTVGLYVPAGFTAVPGGRGTQYYPDKPGQVNAGQVNYNYAQYRNSAGVTVSFVHIGPPVGPETNAAGSTLVGSIAGPGGDGPGYNHTHINFYSNFAKGTRVDPRKLFCKEFGF